MNTNPQGSEMSRASFTGTLVISLVGINVKAYSVAQDPKEDVKIHGVHKECLAELEQNMVCTRCGKVIEKEKRVKGFRWPLGVPSSEQEMYVIEEYELKNVIPEPEEGRPIVVQSVVKPSEVDTLWLDKAYYLAPVGPHDAQSYSLFSRALREEKGIAVVTYVAHSKSHLAVVRPTTQGLILDTLHYAEEIRSLKDVGQEIVGAKLTAKEIQKARQVVKSFRKPLNYSAFKNEGRERFRLLLQAKIEQRPFAAGPIVAARPTDNLMEALEQSLKVLRESGKKQKKAS